MKNFIIAIFAMFAFAALAFIPQESKAQNASFQVNHTFDGSDTYFKIDTLIGKAPVLVILYDSIQTKWVNPANVADSLLATSTATNYSDLTWFTTLLWSQKTKLFGILPDGFYTKIKGSGKLYYPKRYSKIAYYYKP